MPKEEPEHPDGAGTGAHQNIARMTLVLTALAHAGRHGLRLADVTRATKLSKTAAYRCLAGLTRHGLAVLDEDRGRFLLGDQIYAWSIMAVDRFALAERAMPYLERVAEETEDTAYFMVRRGDEAVCLGRKEGRFPIKTLTMDIGERRALGTNTASLAILAFLPDADVERLVELGTRAEHNRQTLPLAALVARTRTDGFSSIEGHVMPGMSGIGVPIRNAANVPVAALSVAAISSRLAGARRAMVVRRLTTEAARMAADLEAIL